MQHQLSYFHTGWLSKTDGPGLRVVLFLQGCPLDCAWCHSPHSQPSRSPLLFFEFLCNNCGRCAEACEQGVHLFDKGKHILQRDKCIQCGKCIEACPQSSPYKGGNALSLPTVTDDIDSIFSMLKPQLDLFGSEGGVTFSGGEPLLQYEAVTLLAKKCKEAGMHTALETSGIVPLKSIEAVAPYIDTWLFGMRLTTGTSKYSPEYLEKQTRRTFRFLADSGAKIIIRIPAIPGYTDTSEFLGRLRDIIGNFSCEDIDILPQNEEGSHYYTAMGAEYSISFDKEKADKAIRTINNYLKQEKTLKYDTETKSTN